MSLPGCVVMCYLAACRCATCCAAFSIVLLGFFGFFSFVSVFYHFVRVLRNTRHTAASQATCKTITYGRYCLLQRHLFSGPEGGASLRMWLLGSLFCDRNGHYASRVYPPVLSAPFFMLYPSSDHQSLVERPLSFSRHAYERSARAALLVSDRVTEIRRLPGQLLFRPSTIR